MILEAQNRFFASSRAFLPISAPALLRSEDLDRTARHIVDVVRFDQESDLPLFDDLRKAADIRNDHRDLARHRLERDEPERLVVAREQQQVGAADQFLDVVPLTQEMDLLFDRRSGAPGTRRCPAPGRLPPSAGSRVSCAAPARKSRSHPSGASQAGNSRDG